MPSPRRTAPGQGDEAVLVAALLLAEEAGETVQQTRRFMGQGGRSATAEEVGADLSDVVISAAILARLLGVDLSEAVGAKLRLGIR